MVCIAAFIIFLCLFPVGMFFGTYRRLFSKAWYCVSRKAQLKPCDSSFGDQVKQELVSSLAPRFPWLAKILLKTADFWAFVIVVISVWSLASVFHSSLNLLVYDTCDPYSEEGCALSGDSCSVGESRAPIWQPRAYIIEGFMYYQETFSRLPEVFRVWNPEEFLVESSTFSGDLKSDLIILEVIDPSCIFCRNQWQAIKNSGTLDQARFTYLLYPIPFQDIEGYRFENSYYITSIIESLKGYQKDFKFIDIYFDSYQSLVNETPASKVEPIIRQILIEELMLSSDEVEDVFTKSQSDEVAIALKNQSRMVEELIKARKIPTLFVGTERFNRVIGTDLIESTITNQRSN